MSAKDNVLNVKELCRVAGVSISGYYAWLKAESKRRERDNQDQKDFALILEAYRHRGYDKGVRGIYMRLKHMGISMNQKKIRRLMRKYNLACPVRRQNPYRQMLRAMKTSAVAENLVNREFEKHGPRTILLTDITYIHLNDNFIYLSVIIDAYTKEVLSYILSESLEVDFVLQTINLLMKHHGEMLSADTIIHSDQGSHYTSIPFRQLVGDIGLRSHTSTHGNPFWMPKRPSMIGWTTITMNDTNGIWQNYPR